MSQIAIIRLVKSMSKVEKRQFKIGCKKQDGNKIYLDLFDIIDQVDVIDITILKEKFRKLHPSKSLDNTSRYLLKLLTDSLIHTKTKDDGMFQAFHGIMRMRILFERASPEEGYKELKKLQQEVARSQNHLLQYFFYREELNYFSEINFSGFYEGNLAETQSKARDALKTLRNVHEHSSLYELLKYRAIHSGKIVSEEGKKRLNDLILSEIGLMTEKVKHNFETNKIHLLFQSFFLTGTGDYKSALKTFNELNKLFEENIFLWNNPPLEYFSSLEGILDNLRTIKYFAEMPFYINKMEQLNTKSYPEHFRFAISKSIMVYQIAIFTGKKDYEGAVNFIENLDPLILKAHSTGMVDDDAQIELLFSFSLSYFGIKNYKTARKYINKIVLISKIKYQSTIYKASKLLSIIIHYDNNNLDYIDNEIRSYKRSYPDKAKSLKTEKIIFNTIKIHPNINIRQKNEVLCKNMTNLAAVIENDKFEKQLLKYFDFTGWVKEKFEKQ